MRRGAVPDTMVGRGGQHSFDILCASLADLDADFTVTYEEGDDVVYKPLPDCDPLVPLWKTQRSRRSDRGMVVNPPVDAPPDPRARGHRIGWASVGTEPCKHRDFVDELAERGVDVVTATDIAHDDMDEWYEGLALLIVPSACEHVGRVALEASRLGVPVLAHAYRGIVDEGVAVSTMPLDADRWLPEIARLAGDPPRRQAAANYARYRHRSLEQRRRLRRLILDTRAIAARRWED